MQTCPTYCSLSVLYEIIQTYMVKFMKKARKKEILGNYDFVFDLQPMQEVQTCGNHIAYPH